MMLQPLNRPVRDPMINRHFLRQRRRTSPYAIVSNPMCPTVIMPADVQKKIKIIFQPSGTAFGIKLGNDPSALVKVHVLESMNQPGLSRGRIGKKMEFSHCVRPVSRGFENPCQKAVDPRRSAHRWP